MVGQLQIIDNLQNIKNIYIITINNCKQQQVLQLQQQKPPLYMDTLLALIVVIVVMASASSNLATAMAKCNIYFSTTPGVVSNDVLVYRLSRIWCFR